MMLKIKILKYLVALANPYILLDDLSQLFTKACFTSEYLFEARALSSPTTPYQVLKIPRKKIKLSKEKSESDVIEII